MGEMVVPELDDAMEHCIEAGELENHSKKAPNQDKGPHTKFQNDMSQGQKQPEVAKAAPEEPSVAEICENFGLNDVELDHTAYDYQTITSYELFQQTYKKKIQEGNPKVPKPKLAMLVAAKWREFQVWTPTPLSSVGLLPLYIFRSICVVKREGAAGRNGRKQCPPLG